MASAFARAVTTNQRGMRVHQIPAPLRLTLQPEQFASEWNGRPSAPVEIGLRLPCEADFEGAGVEARRQAAARLLPDAEIENATELAFSRVLVARAICDPENVKASHPLLPMADDQVERAFPPLVVKSLFGRIHELHVEQSLSLSEANDSELERLADALTDGDPFQHVDAAQEAIARRHLALALEIIEAI